VPAKKTDDKMECKCPCCYRPWSIVGMVVCALVLPILLIWSLNTLFLISISYSVYTWFAALIVIFVLSGKAMKCKMMGHGCTGCCGGKCDCVVDQKR